MTDGNTVSATRDRIAFDPQFFPFTLRQNAAAPTWQTFHNLTQLHASGAQRPPTLLPPPTAAPQDDNVSNESDFDPDFDSMSIASDTNHDDSSPSTSEDEEDTPATLSTPRPTQASALKANQRLITHHKP